MYGFGSGKYEQSSEHMVGRFANSWRNQAEGTGGVPPVIGSKVFTIPWTNTIMGGGLRTSPESLVTALKGSVDRVGSPLDLWSIHFPFPVTPYGSHTPHTPDMIDRYVGARHPHQLCKHSTLVHRPCDISVSV